MTNPCVFMRANVSKTFWRTIVYIYIKNIKLICAKAIFLCISMSNLCFSCSDAFFSFHIQAFLIVYQKKIYIYPFPPCLPSGLYSLLQLKNHLYKMSHHTRFPEQRIINFVVLKLHILSHWLSHDILKGKEKAFMLFLSLGAVVGLFVSAAVW